MDCAILRSPSQQLPSTSSLIPGVPADRLTPDQRLTIAAFTLQPQSFPSSLSDKEIRDLLLAAVASGDYDHSHSFELAGLSLNIPDGADITFPPNLHLHNCSFDGAATVSFHSGSLSARTPGAKVVALSADATAIAAADGVKGYASAKGATAIAEARYARVYVDASGGKGIAAGRDTVVEVLASGAEGRATGPDSICRVRSPGGLGYLEGERSHGIAYGVDAIVESLHPSATVVAEDGGTARKFGYRHRPEDSTPRTPFDFVPKTPDVLLNKIASILPDSTAANFHSTNQQLKAALQHQITLRKEQARIEALKIECAKHGITHPTLIDGVIQGRYPIQAAKTIGDSIRPNGFDGLQPGRMMLHARPISKALRSADYNHQEKVAIVTDLLKYIAALEAESGESILPHFVPTISHAIDKHQMQIDSEVLQNILKGWWSPLKGWRHPFTGWQHPLKK